RPEEFKTETQRTQRTQRRQKNEEDSKQGRRVDGCWGRFFRLLCVLCASVVNCLLPGAAMIESAPLEAILRLCAAAAPVPWYPKTVAADLGLRDEDLAAFVEQLR